ncbi:MAG: hypothetical protein U0792_01790 [Gemmataceae bacterium]
MFDAAPIQAFDVDPNERPNLVALPVRTSKIRRLEFSLVFPGPMPLRGSATRPTPLG